MMSTTKGCCGCCFQQEATAKSTINHDVDEHNNNDMSNDNDEQQGQQ